MHGNNRLLELDALRGLAALAVVLFHYTVHYDKVYGQVLPSYYGIDFGYLGVHLFFMISGFVIFMTLTKLKSTKEFALKRIIRLYPAYIVAVLLTFVVVKLYGLEGRVVSYFDAIVNLTMFHWLVGIPHVDGVYWSLRVELTFYILMGILLYFGLIKRIVTISYLWLIASSFVQLLNIFIDHFLFEGLVDITISNYSHLFIAGMMFYLIRTNEKESHTKYYGLLIACILYQFLFFNIVESLVTTAFFVVFYLLIKQKLSFLNFRPLLFLGTISYSFYLIHQNIGYVVINIMENSGLVGGVYIIIPLAISLILATLLTYFIEKPIANFLSNKMRARKAKQEKKANLINV